MKYTTEENTKTEQLLIGRKYQVQAAREKVEKLEKRRAEIKNGEDSHFDWNETLEIEQTEES